MEARSGIEPLYTALQSIYTPIVFNSFNNLKVAKMVILVILDYKRRKYAVQGLQYLSKVNVLFAPKGNI